VTDLPIDLQTDEAAATEALEYATFVLWALSGRMYYPVTTTIEAYDTRMTLAAYANVYPVFLYGTPYNLSGCRDCACSACGVFHRTRLRGYPVQNIISVVVDGTLLSASEYVLLDYSVLGLTSPSACNARCITVEYEHGSGIPPGGKNAVVKLASELLLSATGAQCALPERVTSVTRQGMSFTLLDPQDFLDKGRTGIYEIDLMLRAVNPAGALKRPRVFSPDIRRAEVKTTFADAPQMMMMASMSDQLVLPGETLRWMSYEPAMVEHVRDGAKLVTELSDGTILTTPWKLNVTLDGREFVTLDLTSADMLRLSRGMFYTVRDSTGLALLHGEVQKF
jgi:hypothetical protein